MDALKSVEKETLKLVGKYDNCRKNMEKQLDGLIDHIKSVRDGLCQDCEDESVLSPLQMHMLSACSKRVKETTSKITQEHKDLHTYVSKVGKAIDRNFTTDFSGTTQENIFSGSKGDLLNEAIYEHLLRQGHVDVADQLVLDADLTLDPKHKEPFTELNQILSECRNKNLEPALAWAIANRDRLSNIGSNLEFKLHKLKFLSLLEQGCYKESLEYSRIFSKFTGHAKEIQRLMCCFAFIKSGLETSPYQDLFDTSHWLDISDQLSRDACSLLGLSVTSPLETSVTAGCIALPTLLQLKQVMQQRQVEGMWNSKEELPVEIELGREFQFHSIFACPILRQQCGRTNPPMRLMCGHVISKDALQRLSHGNRKKELHNTLTSKIRLKCPYCPVEMDPREAKRLYFS